MSLPLREAAMEIRYQGLVHGCRYPLPDSLIRQDHARFDASTQG